MDPLSQGTVGAAFAQSTANKNNIFKIGVIGFLAGLAPDLDILIKSSTDPILFLEYHRQFTHSLFFILCIRDISFSIHCCMNIPIS